MGAPLPLTGQVREAPRELFRLVAEREFCWAVATLGLLPTPAPGCNWTGAPWETERLICPLGLEGWMRLVLPSYLENTEDRKLTGGDLEGRKRREGSSGTACTSPFRVSRMHGFTVGQLDAAVYILPVCIMLWNLIWLLGLYPCGYHILRERQIE